MARIIPARYTLAIVLFIIVVFIVLTIGAIRLFGYTPPSIQRYPPWVSQCPDYWINNGDGTCTYNTATPNGFPTCDSTTNSGKAPASDLMYTPNKPVHVNKYSWKDLCKWTKSCDIYWEGISDQNCNDQKHFNNYSSPSSQ